MKKLLFLAFVILQVSACSVLASEGVPLIEHFKEAAEVVPGVECRLTRFELDVTADGMPEMFLAQSQNAGKGGLSWIIYSPVGGGQYRVLGREVFHIRGFRYDPTSAQLVVVRGRNIETSFIVTYRIDSGGIMEVQRDEVANGSQTLSEEKQNDQAWRDEVGLKFWSIAIEDLEESSQPVWKSRLSQEEEIRDLEGVVIP